MLLLLGGVDCKKNYLKALVKQELKYSYPGLINFFGSRYS